MISNPLARYATSRTTRGHTGSLRDYRDWEQELAAVGARWLEQLEELVNRYPGGAVAVAFSLGVGLGWWIKRHK